MGYAGPSIAAQEWIELINSDPKFREPLESERAFLGPHARIWNSLGMPVAFDWRAGRIEVKDPAAPTITKMIEITRILRANVFSESGEAFSESGHHAGFLPGFEQSPIVRVGLSHQERSSRIRPLAAARFST